MAGQWDEVMKRLLHKNPQDFTTWIVKEGMLSQMLSTEIQRRSLFVDALMKVKMLGQELLLHLEFQRCYDEDMPERLLEYNVQASRVHNHLPVLSCVIYLIEDRKVQVPPLIRRLPDGHEVLRFNYRSIELWTIPAEEILQTNLSGLFPLLPLTRGGKQPEILDTMIESLASAGEKELLAATYILAGLVFKDKVDQKWLRRRFAMLGEILRDSWVYKEIMQEGHDKGLEEGRQEGLQEGRQEGLQEGLQEGRQEGLQEGLLLAERQERQRQQLMLNTVVRTRFPDLVPLATQRTEGVTNPNTLQLVIIKLLETETEEQARQILNDILIENV